MDQATLKKEIEQIMDRHSTGTLATVINDKPSSRYMTFFHEGLTLYTPTSIDTHKAEEIEANSNIHVLLGYTGEGYNDAYIEFEGEAIMRSDSETKERFWIDHLNEYFDGQEDPKLVFLELIPRNIRLMNRSGENPQELSI
ncbi:pyridoxamine 5'-phosphate oxidase family protein [Alkalicoccobacillus porphyridii]|uniref:General stress protein n=1 Tax=Alkalicoccobacillus porphyridii TaxID=2597270 RepID=A0A553ZYN2_9BACI|nr:pyridoxamine 5'-phosphate oxidase family protein [Alkalicoccobacillus porphyridii]TSB46560.1 general stress protein [Alkalicoccobacillus porphyridii]